MLRSYYRYDLRSRFGIYTHPGTPVHYDGNGNIVTCTKYSILVLNPKTHLPLSEIPVPEGEEITSFCVSVFDSSLAVGTNNGTVRLYVKGDSGGFTSSFEGKAHKSGVKVLKFSSTRLFSGGNDGDIVVFDTNSPLFRLRGHKNEITDLEYLPTSNLLVSASKDKNLKVWELPTQHCIQTRLCSSEIWALAVDPLESRLLVGTGEQSVDVWNIDPLKELMKKSYERRIESIGTIVRASEKRVREIKFHPSGNIVGILSDEKYLELFKVRSRKRQMKLFRKSLKALLARQKGETDDEKKSKHLEELNEVQKSIAQFEFKRMNGIKFRGKCRSFVFNAKDFSVTVNAKKKAPKKNVPSKTRNLQVRVLLASATNTMEEWNIMDPKSYKRTLVIGEREAHAKQITSISLSSDDAQVCSVSDQECKIWNVNGKPSVVRSMKYPGSARCSMFLPANNYVALGTGKGRLIVLDVNSSLPVVDLKAHNAEITGMCVKPDKNGILSVSSDKQVRIWDFALKENVKTKASSLSLELVHTLQMKEAIVGIKISRNGTYLALSCLDNSVKVFYLDTLKFYLSLYGHHLPVMDLDISSDEFLCATAGGDKNVKVWSLQFGNCTKSVFAHNTPITSVRFIGETHHFFTCARDGALKRWNADKNCELIQVLRPETRFAPLSAMCVSAVGDIVITACSDRSIALYKETDDLLFISEEREKRMENEYAKELVTSQEFSDLSRMTESSHPGKRTVETIRNGDELVEDLKVIKDDQEAWDEYNKQQKIRKENPDVVIPTKMILEEPGKNPLLMGMERNEYFIHSLTKIKKKDIDMILTVIPYTDAVFMMRCVESLFLGRTDQIRIDVQLLCRIVITLFKIHSQTLTKDMNMFSTMKNLKNFLQEGLQREKDSVGFNMAALKFIKRRLSGEKFMREMNEKSEKAGVVKKKRKREGVDEEKMKKLKKKLKLK